MPQPATAYLEMSRVIMDTGSKALIDLSPTVTIPKKNGKLRKMIPIAIYINDEQRIALESLIHKDKTESRLSRRAVIILQTIAGEKRSTIAKSLGVNPSVVTKWKKRFAIDGIDGLLDMPRSGRPRKYNTYTEERVLSVLDKKPPSGAPRWNRFLIAAELGDVTAHQVWRIMKKNKISLDYRKNIEVLFS
jgi:transposase